MALNKISKAKLLKARMYAHPIQLHRAQKLCKQAKDIELFIIRQEVNNEIKRRGLNDE